MIRRALELFNWLFKFLCALAIVGAIYLVNTKVPTLLDGILTIQDLTPGTTEFFVVYGVLIAVALFYLVTAFASIAGGNAFLFITEIIIDIALVVVIYLRYADVNSYFVIAGIILNALLNLIILVLPKPEAKDDDAMKDLERVAREQYYQEQTNLNQPQQTNHNYSQEDIDKMV